MPETTTFLDEEHRIASEADATRLVVRTTDDSGQLISERWYVLTLPRPGDLPEPSVSPRRLLLAMLIGVILGVALGWLL